MKLIFASLLIVSILNIPMTAFSDGPRVRWVDRKATVRGIEIRYQYKEVGSREYPRNSDNWKDHRFNGEQRYFYNGQWINFQIDGNKPYGSANVRRYLEDNTRIGYETLILNTEDVTLSLEESIKKKHHFIENTDISHDEVNAEFDRIYQVLNFLKVEIRDLKSLIVDLKNTQPMQRLNTLGESGAVEASLSIPTNGLIAYYPLYGDVNDYSGNNLHGEAIGDPFNDGASYTFDGSNDNLVFSRIPQTPSMTLIIIAKSITSKWNSYGSLASSRGSNGFIIHPNKNNSTVGMYIVDSNAKYQKCGQVSPSNIQQYHTYSLTYDNKKKVGKTYLNGSFNNACSLNMSRNNSGVFSFLAGKDRTAYGKINIKEIIYYDRALNQNEIKNIHNNRNSN